jgi:hypothetical protein
VWSKVGRFVEGLHTVGDILTRVSVNCVLIYMLHYYLCVIFMGISFICFMIWLLSFPYESMHLQYVFICLSYIYKVLQESLCVYVFNCITA